MIGARFDDASTWVPVLVRCPKCSKTVVPEGAAEHQAWHLLWRVGEYMTRDLKPVRTRAEADAMYVGSGRAMFFDDRQMRWVGTGRPG